jgi:hypothetical protein
LRDLHPCIRGGSSFEKKEGHPNLFFKIVATWEIQEKAFIASIERILIKKIKQLKKRSLKRKGLFIYINLEHWAAWSFMNKDIMPTESPNLNDQIHDLWVATDKQEFISKGKFCVWHYAFNKWTNLGLIEIELP